MKMYVGNCVNSFDEDGDCVINELPYSTTSDFAYDVEDDVKYISKDQFEKETNIKDLKIKFSNMVVYMITSKGVYIAYDDKKDIHYFFA